MDLAKVADAAIGVGMGVPTQIAVEKFLKLVVEPVFYRKKWVKKLEETALLLKPSIDEYVEIASNPNFSDLSNPRIQPYKEFQGLLQSAIDVARKAEETNILDLRYANEIHEFVEKIDDFTRNEGSPTLALHLQQLTVDVSILGRKLELMESRILQKISPTQTNIDGIHGAQAAERSNRFNSKVQRKPKKTVGLYKRIEEVKQILNQSDVNIVGITGMGGSGKTTLASALCHDPGVKDTFQSNIHFIIVSQFHGNENAVCKILEIMCHSIFGGEKPKFQSIEYGRNQLQNNLNRFADQKTLVVLHDVWPGLIVNNLLFTAEGYKTIIITRDNSIIQCIRGAILYEIPELNDADALSLFCFWAFGQASIPPTANGDLVREVAAECKGLPLALEVIGSSLHSQKPPKWEVAKEKLSKSEPISTDHEAKLFGCLKTSIDTLSEKERRCFLDLGAFPKGRRFGVGSLLDIWIYVREMTWLEAFDVLSELASRNLMHLTDGEGSAAIDYHCASELSFSQHDVMRDLALHLSNQDNNILCKRLFMPRKEANIPTEWLSAAQSSSAQFVSIHTGAMKEEDWGQINFPKAEALTLFFDAKQYCLPTFLQSMSNLKVLIVYNYSSQRVTLSGLPSFPSSVQIKSVLLYKLIVPSSFYENCRSWERLEKLYICRCDDLGNITPVDKDKESEALNFPKLLEINFDHCRGLMELPIGLSNITSLQMLSVTNCHLIGNLPVDLETLSSLRVLRLSACTSLSRLPPSISKLAQLKYLDISCTSLGDLPAEFDHLTNLKTLDMRECSRLKKLPNVKPRRLERVIIYETEKESRGAWRKSPAAWSSILHAVAMSNSLDWLSDH